MKQLKAFAFVCFSQSLYKKWWAKMDSNHRPHDYQSCALASWAIGPYLVEIKSTFSVLKSFHFKTLLCLCFSSPNQTRFAGLWFGSIFLVESTGIEPVTSCLQGRRSPSWANPPLGILTCLGTSFPVPSKLNNVKTLTLCTDLRTLHKKSSFLMKSP